MNNILNALDWLAIQGSLIGCWADLKAHLERRGRDLGREVGQDPAPIACCTGQLPSLLEQRARVNRTLREMAAAEPPRPHSLEWLESVEVFLAHSEAAVDDEPEIALRARLRALVATALSA